MLVILARDFEVAQAIALLNIEGALHQKVATRPIDIAGNAHKVQGCRRHAQCRKLLLESEAPLDGGRLGGCVNARSLADIFSRHIADLGRPVGVLALHRLDELLVAVAPLVDEVVVDEVLVDDGVEHGDAERGVGAGAHLQEVLSAGAQPGQARIDGDDLGAHLHALDDPVAQEAVGVGLERLVAPHHDDVGAAEGGIRIPQLMRLGHVDDVHLAHLCRRGNHAGQIACKAGEAEVANIRRLKRSRREERELPADISTCTMIEEDGVGPVVLLDVINLLHNDVVGLVPADALPLVLAARADALEGPLRAVGVVHALHQIQAAHAQAAVGAGIERVALDLFQLAVLGVHEHAAGIMAAGRRVGVGARYGVAVLLPLPLALVIGLTIY